MTERLIVTFGDGEESSSEMKITQLPMGAANHLPTCSRKCRNPRHNPKGWKSEAKYLSVYRQTQYFRISDSEERASHRRWANSAPSLVQQKLDEYWGAKSAAKLRAKAALPAAYGCPNLILGT